MGTIPCSLKKIPRGYPSPVKGAGFRVPSRRRSQVQLLLHAFPDTGTGGFFNIIPPVFDNLKNTGKNCLKNGESDHRVEHDLIHIILKMPGYDNMIRQGGYSG